MKRIGTKGGILALVLSLFVVAGGVGFLWAKYPDILKRENAVSEQVLRIDNIVSNLSAGSAIKISVTVILSGSESENVLAQEDGIRDAIINRLRVVQKPELDGVEGMDFLRMALLDGARSAVGKNDVKEILIREFVVQ